MDKLVEVGYFNSYVSDKLSMSDHRLIPYIHMYLPSLHFLYYKYYILLENAL